MSTNDEIRKALHEALEEVSDYSMSRFLTTGHLKEARVDRILTALAPYLAPHPAQQGEDGELLDWLEKNASARWGDEDDREVAHVVITVCAPIGVSKLPRTSIRAAIRIARSHSKQEGGA
jgi:hypothetical protein